MNSLLTTIPDRQQCLRLMDKYSMLDNIRAHSLKVALVAEQLHDLLAASASAEHLPDKSLVIAGALLHDIAKTKCISEGCRHAQIGAYICLDEGLPEIAEIVTEHVILFDPDPIRWQEGRFLAKELVYYSDKRVKHDQIVALDERLDYIIDRYGADDEYTIQRIRKNFTTCINLEKAIFECAGISPKDHIF